MRAASQVKWAMALGEEDNKWDASTAAWTWFNLGGDAYRKLLFEALMLDFRGRVSGHGMYRGLVDEGR